MRLLTNFRYMGKPLISFGYRSILGGVGGTYATGGIGVGAGLLAGASYNPDIVDDKTGKTRKLGLLSRATLVSGGGALGAVGGHVGGAMIGGTGGAILDKIRG
jgi:hypothetical protein